MPHAKKLSGYPLWELRVKQGSSIVRLFYFAMDGTTYVVTSGFAKKSDRTNQSEIERAMRLRAAFLEGRDEQR
jgi:phage-related protein